MMQAAYFRCTHGRRITAEDAEGIALGERTEGFCGEACPFQESQAEIGPRQLHSEPICYTTMKLAKVVGFSAGSTMMGNFGQGTSFIRFLGSEGIEPWKSGRGRESES